MSDEKICSPGGFDDQGLHTENKETQVEGLFSLYIFIMISQEHSQDLARLPTSGLRALDL